VALDNTRFASNFGIRTDPIYGTPRMHQGIDLAGKRGEPIYAVGNGKIVEVGFNFFGYGNEIVIDHGFGYKTRYAHLDKIFVKEGDVVERGDEIAALGNTGKSTGDHLHYEVIYRDRRVNPLNYYNQDIKGEEFMAMVKPIDREKLLDAKFAK
jgi:Membrane proteins related to metalloendopeptidases